MESSMYWEPLEELQLQERQKIAGHLIQPSWPMSFGQVVIQQDFSTMADAWKLISDAICKTVVLVLHSKVKQYRAE